MRSFVLVVLALVAAAAVTSPVSAQRRVRRGTDTAIVIRGTVPTPQVVTVRPREAPTYSRASLVPQFYNRTFLADILPAYQLVSMRQLTAGALAGANVGPSAPALELEIESIRRELEIRQMRLDSIAAKVRTLGAPDSTARLPAGPPPADTTRRRPPSAQAGSRVR